jgi:hypothetical protein
MSGKSTFGIAAIRKAAKLRAQDTSLHAAASEIPMSYTAFRHFLKGSKPQPRTLNRLVRWYAEARTGKAGPKPDDVDAAIALLINHIVRAGDARAISKRLKEVLQNLQPASESVEEVGPSQRKK